MNLDKYINWFSGQSFLFKFLSCTLAFLSLSTAHYLGFVWQLPEQIVILGGADLIVSINKVFIIYAVCALVLARILAVFIDGYFNFLNCIVSFIETKKIPRLFLQVIIFLLVMTVGYFKVLYFYSEVGAFILIPILIFLFPVVNPAVLFLLKKFVRIVYYVFWSFFRLFVKITVAVHPDEKEETKRGIADILTTIVTVLVIAAFLTGFFRKIYVEQLPAVEIKSGTYSGKAKIVVAQQDSLILLEDNKTYIFISKDIGIIRINLDSKNEFGSVLSN